MARESPPADTADRPAPVDSPDTRSSETRAREAEHAPIAKTLEAQATVDSRPPAREISLVPAGTVLDEVYRIKKLIGKGAMGAVYLAEHITLGKDFAVKVVGRHGEVGPSDAAVQRLIREAQTASAIEHDNIVNVTHLGRTDDGFPFIVMELLRGENLREHHLRVSGSDDQTKPLADDFVRSIVPQVLDALGAAHDAGIIHRDLKPDNIFLAEKRGKIVAKLVDFGMSKVAIEAQQVRLTKTGQILGTPLYMSPEQGKNVDELDARSDLYSVGVIIYEMLAGEVPFPAETIYQCVFKHISEMPPPLAKRRPDLPEGIVACVHKALAKDPDDRFQSAAEFSEAWRSAWTGEALPHDQATSERTVNASRTPPADAATAVVARTTLGAPEPTSRSRTWFYLVVALVAIGAVGILVATSGNDGEREATRTEPPTEPREPTPEPVEPEPTVMTPPPMNEPSARTVRIASQPSGAEVHVAGELRGTTPLDVEIPPGSSRVSVELKRRGFETRSLELLRDGPDDILVELTRRPQAKPPELAPR